MELIRSVVVLDAADLRAESTFWAGMLDGHVFEDEAFHSVMDSTGEWRIGVQLAPVTRLRTGRTVHHNRCTWISMS